MAILAFLYTLSLSLGISCVVVLAVFLVYIIYTYYYDPLSSVPNLHWSSPLSRLHYLHSKYSNRHRAGLLTAHRNQSDEDGFQPLVRVGPREVSIMTTSGVKTVLDTSFERDTWYDAFKNFGYV